MNRIRPTHISDFTNIKFYRFDNATSSMTNILVLKRSMAVRPCKLPVLPSIFMRSNKNRSCLKTKTISLYPELTCSYRTSTYKADNIKNAIFNWMSTINAIIQCCLFFNCCLVWVGFWVGTPKYKEIPINPNSKTGIFGFFLGKVFRLLGFLGQSFGDFGLGLGLLGLVWIGISWDFWVNIDFLTNFFEPVRKSESNVLKKSKKNIDCRFSSTMCLIKTMSQSCVIVFIRQLITIV